MTKISYDDLWNMQGMCTRLHELMPELLEEMVILRGRSEGLKSDEAELKKLRGIVEAARSALGYHPDSDIDLALEIMRLRDQARESFHKTTDAIFSPMRYVQFEGRRFVQLTDLHWYEQTPDGRKTCASDALYIALTTYDGEPESTAALRLAIEKETT